MNDGEKEEEEGRQEGKPAFALGGERGLQKSMQMDEYGKNIGIRLVYGIAEDVIYQNLLGLNVLTIRV